MRNNGPVIDFHNHFYPKTYLDHVRAGTSNVRFTTDDEGNPVLHYPGDYNVVVPGHRDIAHRASTLEQHGVDSQVLTFTSPGTHVEPPDRAAQLARSVNDAFAEIVAAHPGRFTALATLPLNTPKAAALELERAMTELHMPGAMLFSNVNGESLSDGHFQPVWEKADALGAVLYIHPIHPVGVEAMAEYWLMPLVGFLSDTTLAAAKLVFSGTVQRYPNIRWVLAHLGGTIPYIAERLDRGFDAFPECREHIDRPPSEYLRRFYYDTVNFDPRALRIAIDFAGADRILAGSDYPHRIGSIPRMLESIAALDVSPEERSSILGGNAKRLLRLGDAVPRRESRVVSPES